MATDPREAERLKLIDGQDWSTNIELRDAVAEVKRQQGVATMPAYQLAKLLPEHLRSPFWEDAVKYYLADANALADAAIRDGWMPPGERDRLVAERDKAVRERDEARAERDQLRYERRLLGFARMVLDRQAEYDNLHPVDRERIASEAADIAQRIVDEIGHPVTDEEALGPSFREQIDAMRPVVEKAKAWAELAVENCGVPTTLVGYERALLAAVDAYTTTTHPTENER